MPGCACARATVAAVPSLAWVFWSLPVLLAPPLFSRDAYSYAAQGLIVQRGLDPYAYGPYWVPGQFADQVDPMWMLTPAPYGPLALQVQHAVVAIAGDNAYLAAVLMRLPALAAVALLAWTLPRLAKRFGVNPSQALWLAVLNPLVIMHFVGGAHGDAIMVALVVLALYVASLGRFWVGRRPDRGRRDLQADRCPRPHRRHRHGDAGRRHRRPRRFGTAALPAAPWR